MIGVQAQSLETSMPGIRESSTGEAKARGRGTTVSSAAPSQLGIHAVQAMREWINIEGCVANGPIDVVDLFCGCGGMSLGFELVGRMAPSFRLAAAADIDQHSVN